MRKSDAKKPFVDEPIVNEEYREYEFLPPGEKTPRVYRINKPARLIIQRQFGTHRIVDAAGIVHLVPGIGSLGCVLRWKPIDSTLPVAF